jgi:hypothetical protein
MFGNRLNAVNLMHARILKFYSVHSNASKLGGILQ